MQSRELLCLWCFPFSTPAPFCSLRVCRASGVDRGATAAAAGCRSRNVVPPLLRISFPPSAPSAWKVTSQESGAKPLTFTFVPSIGRLPTHVEVVDISKFLVTIPEEPKNLSNQEINNKSNTISDELALKSGARQDCVSIVGTDSTRTPSQSPGCKSSKGEMQENDLFKAEFILITDSGDEDEVAAASNNIQRPSNGYSPISAQLLDTSHISPGTGAGKPPGDGHIPGAALSHSTADPQKHQLISTLSTSDDLSSKPPAVHFISPINQRVVCRAMVNLNQASSLEDSRNNWQSATGSSKHYSSLYFQSAHHSSPPSMPKISSSASNSCHATSRSCDNRQTSLVTPGCVCKTGDFTTSSVPAKSHSHSPSPSHSAEVQGSSAQPLSPSSSKRLNAFCPVPVHIITHSLSPSPKPLSPPSLYGSSSTICSLNEPCSEMSSRGNLAKSGVKSPLPTRLTLLTAILRSGSSKQRPLSPASCPTFSRSFLGSSTFSIDQKSKTTPPTPKKSVSSPPRRTGSPSREEYWLSGWAQHLPLPPKPHPTPRARSLSPKNHLPVGMFSSDSQSPLSSPVSSHRNSVASPGLQSTLPPPCASAPSSLAHPTSPSPEGLQFAASKSWAPQKSQRVHTYSPIFTCRSYPLLSSDSVSGIIIPSNLEKYAPPSPGLLHSASRSKSYSSQMSVEEMSASSPIPSSLSKQWCLSRPHSTPPVPQTGNINSHPLQFNSSLVHTNYTSNSSSPRPEQSGTSPPLQCRSPVSDKSPGTLPSRPRELTSPQSFFLPPDHENIKPKALEEPAKTASVTEGTALDTHSEMCSPAQLRQQTEELCAVIDQVLQDPLTMRRCESSPSFLQMNTESDIGKVSTTAQKAAGRETRYASLYKSAPMMTESQLTKPGVIRPVLVKAKSAQQMEEPYQSNPFKKYLEEINDQDIEKETPLLHPLYPTKLIPPTKSPLRPPSVSLARCLNPGPFSHLSSSMSDVHENPYSPYSHNSLYNKPSHPIVPIPENEALSSKEVANERGSV
ncbi:muscular LMNA-interacting protein isoform X4 [Heliangelus exortis]|uniref:muscular LMNA-interacting protein isoform X4 n=1 Tax=Heliangelus exortis TaxID=472823 RepID=UPI003A953DED